MRYTNRHFTYLLTFPGVSVCVCIVELRSTAYL